MTTRVPNATNTDPGNKYLPALINGPETPTQKKPTPANTREHNRRLSLPTEPNFEKSPFDKNYNTLVKESPWIDPIRAGLGRIQQGLQVAGQTVSDLSGSVTELTQTGLQKSTTNPTVTTAVAVGGTGVMGLLSMRSLINTFKNWQNPRSGSWAISALQTIIQGGLTFALGSPLFGNGEKSPLAQNIDGENSVPLKTILGGVGASALLGAFNMLSEDRLPIVSKIPVINKLAGSIAKDLRGGVDSLTTAQPLNEQSAGGIPGMPTGMAA